MLRVTSECIPSATKCSYARTIIFNYSVDVDGWLVVLRRVILADLFELQPYTFKEPFEQNNSCLAVNSSSKLSMRRRECSNNLLLCNLEA